MATSRARRESRRNRPAVGWLWRGYGFVVTGLRYPILLAWIAVAVAVAATLYLPRLSASGSVTGLIPRGAPALQAEYHATRLFGLPLTSQAAVVQYNPHRFSIQAQARAARQALAVDQGRVRKITGVAGALPVTNTAGAFPGSRERSTTIITCLLACGPVAGASRLHRSQPVMRSLPPANPGFTHSGGLLVNIQVPQAFHPDLEVIQPTDPHLHRRGHPLSQPWWPDPGLRPSAGGV